MFHHFMDNLNFEDQSDLSIVPQPQEHPGKQLFFLSSFFKCSLIYGAWETSTVSLTNFDGHSRLI
jgi:hypothetical protein